MVCFHSLERLRYARVADIDILVTILNDCVSPRDVSAQLGVLSLYLLFAVVKGNFKFGSRFFLVTVGFSRGRRPNRERQCVT